MSADRTNIEYEEDGYEVFGELMEFEPIKPRLLKWVDSLNPDLDVWINLQQVTVVNQTEEEDARWLAIKVGNTMSSTSDPDTIQRFWEQWEVV